jgi:hypothetical protein
MWNYLLPFRVGQEGDFDGAFSISHFFKVGIYADTDNALSESLPGYENIVVSRPISVISDDLAKLVAELPKGSGLSDCILMCYQLLLYGCEGQPLVLYTYVCVF